MQDIKLVRERLWNSLDMHWVKRCLIVVAVCMGFSVVIGIGVIQFVFIMGITLLPFLGFCLWRTFRIFQHPESYFFCKTMMSSPKGGNIRDTIRFTVVLEDPEGGKFVANTHSIFDTHGSSVLAFENYVNKTVTVGYNEETGMVVVIG